MLVPKRDAFVDFDRYSFDCAFCPSCHRLWIDSEAGLACLAPDSEPGFDPSSRKRSEVSHGPGKFEQLFEKVIRQTRYQGTYEFGRWIAYVVAGGPELPRDAFGEDVPCRGWWQISDGSEHARTARIGRGESADDALEDLARRWHQAGSPTTFDWFDAPEEADLT